VATFVVLLTIAGWAVADGHVHGMEEIPRAFLGMGPTLLLGVIAYAMYLAAEPFVRRVWPHSLIAWSRLLAGRYHDPLVGRDLLIGIAVGVAVAAVGGAGIMASLATHGPGAMAAGQDPSLLRGWRSAWTYVTSSTSILDGLLLLYLVTAARFILKRGWLALLAVGLVVSAFDLATGLPTGAWWIAAMIGPLREAAFVLTLARFGLVAVCAAELASGIVGNGAFSFNLSLPHVAYSWPPILFLVGLALVGFWMATSVSPSRAPRRS
jgi:hypothetical protein